MPSKDFDQMREQIYHLMSAFFKDAKPLGYQQDRSFHPPMDIYETQDNLVVVLEVAGVRPEEIRVTFEKDLLSISGARKETLPAPKTRLHQMEIDYGDFQRTLHIPFPVKTDAIKANYRQGFLIITVPKMKEPISKTVEVILR